MRKGEVDWPSGRDKGNCVFTAAGLLAVGFGVVAALGYGAAKLLSFVPI